MENRNMPSKPVDAYYDGELGTSPATGLTKLEYAAIAAMQGLLSYGDVTKYDNADEWKKDIEESAVEFANGLFDELEREKE